MDDPRTNDRVHGVILRALRAVNELLPSDQQIAPEPEERLIGPEGKLDSLAYINLVTALEQEFENEFGRPLSLASDGGAGGSDDPFRTVASLSAYLVTRSEEGPTKGRAADG